MGEYVGRFAPSPTGDLHLGSLVAAVVSWIAARQVGGRFILRVEDLDRPRVLAGMAAQQIEDLRWLGLEWDEGPDVSGAHSPYVQSEATEAYDRALNLLQEQDLLYFCDCSRKEIAELASAPHGAEMGPVYTGRCRSQGMAKREFRRPPAIRLRVPQGEMVVRDRWQGLFRQDVAAEVGDFVLRRGDGVTTYQLAVVVDDERMGVTEIVRGSDLLSSAPRQMLLDQLLGGAPKTFAHLPMVLAEDGSRLAKRYPRGSLREQRAAGRNPEELLEEIMGLLGLLPQDRSPGPLSARELIASADLGRLTQRLEMRLPRGYIG